MEEVALPTQNQLRRGLRIRKRNTNSIRGSLMEYSDILLSKESIMASLIGAVGLIFFVRRLYNALVENPERLRSALRKQGVSGPRPTLLLGNILEIKKARDHAAASKATADGAPVYHNCAPIVLPFLDQWRKQYGDTFLFGYGNRQVLHVTSPEMVREISTCTSLDFGKPAFEERELGDLLGQGIITSNGPFWAHQRKILAPELYMDKVKGMVNHIQESAITLLESWKTLIDTYEGGVAEIKIDQHMRSFSGDVISRACFGSNFSRGEEIFFKLRALGQIVSNRVLSAGNIIPGMRQLPTKNNKKAWALEKEIKTLILNVVKERTQLAGYEKDLLQMVLEGAKNSNFKSPNAIDCFIVDNCKNIYLAGYETTAISATWCLMLLAANPEWQDRIRAEVLQVCHAQIPDSNMLPKMKLLAMAINESLRLYPPTAVVAREAFRDGMKFGDIQVPKGIDLWISIAAIHTDPEIWGADSYKFNPGRFENGIRGACKHPQMYMPFGFGPRVCLGQNLALVELKLLISQILTNFSISLSPNYKHSPVLNLIVEPRYGVDLLVKKL